MLGQHFDVAAIEFEDRLVAYQIHVGGSGVEKNLLLGDAQCLARARNLAFRLARSVGGLESVVERLRRGRAKLPSTDIFTKAGVTDGIWKRLLIDRFVDAAKILNPPAAVRLSFGL